MSADLNHNACPIANEILNSVIIAFELSLLLPKRGSKAPQAAGKIHTDFEKGFIMAEVMKFSDFKEEGSEGAVKVCFYGAEF